MLAASAAWPCPAGSHRPDVPAGRRRRWRRPEYYRFAHRAGDLQIVPVLGTVAIHAREHNLPCPQLLDPLGPGNRLQPSGNAAAVDVDLEHVRVRVPGSGFSEPILDLGFWIFDRALPCACCLLSSVPCPLSPVPFPLPSEP